MGVIGKILGVGRAAKDVSEVFVANRTEAAEWAAERFQSAQSSYATEFQTASVFDFWINGLNRLPRPLMALGTVGMFAYAMVDPLGFSDRMVGLSSVPEPLWWLLGAIVSFYFGARELHHFRVKQPKPRAIASAKPNSRHRNAALEDWANGQND
ncbi:MAG: holin family protein [Pseudomonadota bacterium]